jgi:hypothetical protein
VFLYIALGVPLISSITAGALIVYRLFQILLGAGESGNIASELSTPAGIVIVAAAVVAYHGMALRRDQVASSAQKASIEAAAVGTVAIEGGRSAAGAGAPSAGEA